MIETIIKDKVLIGIYPCIKKSEQGNIVLFTKQKTGIALSSKTKRYPVGYYSEDWAEEGFRVFSGAIWAEEGFRVFSGAICLFNKEK